MRPPFTTEQFFDVFRFYNLAVWPVQLVLVALALVLVALALASPRASRFVIVGLAALWAWMAIVYHLAFFAMLTPAAYVFAGAFLVEAALLAWHGLRTRRLHFALPRETSATVVGAALIAFALIVYPALAYELGQRYPAMPTFGLPCPTVIFTFGLLTWCVRPIPRSVLWIPAAWALLGNLAAVNLGAREDFGLLPAALLALAFMLWPRKRRATVAPRTDRPLQLGF
ncbi:MAG TPA: DUF6064 family protein [Gemmatimonadaceae bacterium]|nr:DUF6064 family protein [Gemmatimonadaceae bacterium]